MVTRYESTTSTTTLGQARAPLRIDGDSCCRRVVVHVPLCPLGTDHAIRGSDYPKIVSADERTPPTNRLEGLCYGIPRRGARQGIRPYEALGQENTRNYGRNCGGSLGLPHLALWGVDNDT